MGNEAADLDSIAAAIVYAYYLATVLQQAGTPPNEIGMALCVGLYPIGFVGGGSRFPLGFGPWMLAGLIPTFFGLGLILIYVLTREDRKSEKDTEPPKSEPPSAP